MRLRWSRLLVVLATLSLMSSVRAQDARRDQVAAANGRALEALRMQVSTEPIGAGVTVSDLLRKTNSGKTFDRVLARAQQIGGPRWIDAQTCQVRLEIAGPAVSRALVEIASLNRLESPVPPDVLQGRLKEWDRRTFSATGTSTGAAGAEQVRPIADGLAWSKVEDDARRVAVAGARENAVARVMQTINPISLAGEKTVGDVLTNKAVAGEVETWLAGRPVTQVEFRDELQVRMTLAVPGDELFDVFRAAAVKVPDSTGPVNDAVWAKAREAFVARLAPMSCRGSARAGAGKSRPSTVELPRSPPQWIDRHLDAHGTSPARGSHLKAARAAEADATENLRAQLDPLALTAGLTVGDAARQDKQIADAIDRALVGARTTRVEYVDGGGARVTVSLPLRNLWDELQPAP
ncbi:MAG: hypothetical protein ABIP55_16325 [Tepidisphaeraceae bacterium]